MSSVENANLNIFLVTRNKNKRYTTLIKKRGGGRGEGERKERREEGKRKTGKGERGKGEGKKGEGGRERGE